MDYLPGSWLHVPALVVHGVDDDTVPISTSDQFRAAHPGRVAEVRVPGAGHVESWNVDPRRTGSARPRSWGASRGRTPSTTC